MKSISKPNSPIPGEELCVLKMLGNHSLEYEKVYWRAHTQAQRSWAKGLADSPALHFKQRQSHPAAVIRLQPPLWKHLLPFLLDMCHFHHHVPAAANTDCQSTGVAGLHLEYTGSPAWEGSSQPCSPAALQHHPEGTLHPEIAALAQPRLVPSQLPLQTGPTRVLPVMKMADKDCTANLSWPSESYLGLKTAEALSLHKWKWTWNAKSKQMCWKLWLVPTYTYIEKFLLGICPHTLMKDFKC